MLRNSIKLQSKANKNSDVKLLPHFIEFQCSVQVVHPNTIQISSNGGVCISQFLFTLLSDLSVTGCVLSS